MGGERCLIDDASSEPSAGGEPMKVGMRKDFRLHDRLVWVDFQMTTRSAQGSKHRTSTECVPRQGVLRLTIDRRDHQMSVRTAILVPHQP